MDRLDRGTFGHLLRVPHVVLAFFLLVGLIQSTRSQLQALPTELPSLLLFPNIRAQKGQTLGAELYDALVYGKPVLHSGRWGLATLEVCLAIMQSATEHRDIPMQHQVAVPDGV